MSPRQLLRLWELQHGRLSPVQREEFMSHPEVSSIIIYSPTSVLQLLKNNRKLTDLRTALEVHGVIKKRGRASGLARQNSILKKPRPHGGANLPVSDKELPPPKRLARKTPPKERGGDSGLRKIAQQYRWWD